MSRAWPTITRGLRTRLLFSIAVVVIIGGATAWFVVVGVGPAIFHDHMVHLGGASESATLHAEQAFRTASALSLALALAAALLTSVAVSFLLTRRITRSLAPVTEAAGRVADGDYSARVPPVGMGAEFDDLATAFNTMAGDLGRVEASRSRLLGDLAHEMRTPVATLGAYLEAISDGFEHADAPTLAMLRDQVARLSRLGEDIALVTTAEEGRLTMRRTTLSVTQIVASATAQAAGRYTTRGVDLVVRVAPAAVSARVDADRDRIAQVLTNLLDNALRHTAADGRVDVMVDVVGEAVRLVVADDGDGIAREHLPYVFDRFYRIDSARDRGHGGSGIGLAIAKVVTEAHGGTITAHSDGLRRGAVFTVALPLAPATGT
ncbi:sensor histidine kinase [Pengzhenrongella sicca]|uniref:histidine kinase n=1 Tax=Pengzhenrongella sicca TaxID=2819238 RepID=A0A8A4ZBZ5_9MICO|nr:ATP-binding protein [Pengzhenrongella sicca]QTE28116.1 HAMP domain-containing protein [Pengzhenrongella sicca]